MRFEREQEFKERFLGYRLKKDRNVNILNSGANIKTTSSLLGHSGLKHVEKYTRAIDKLKEDAMNSLLDLDI